LKTHLAFLRAWQVFSHAVLTTSNALTVGPTANPEVSQMDIVVSVEGHALEQVIAQLDKLINVIAIKEIKAPAASEVHDTQPDYQN
jgi:acetolactate synthase I/III small subunit